MYSKFRWMSLCGTVAFLAACGGGGGGSDAPSSASPPLDSIPQEQNPTPIDSTTKLSQTIDPFVANSLLINQYYDINSKSSAGLDVKVESLSTQVCQIENKTLKTTQEGTCSLQFSQEGNQNYVAAQPKMIQLPIYSEKNMPPAHVQLCNTGTLANSYKTIALNTLNEIRTLHGLSPVQYDANYDDEMMRTALINLANQALSHTPAKNLTCYSDIGYAGANTSNLELNIHYNFASLDGKIPIINALTERYSADVGHRRWLLSPFLTRISLGAMMDQSQSSYKNYASAYATKVIFPEDLYKATSNATGIIAYPYQDYPARFFEKGVPLSLSLLIDQKGSWNNQNVDYSQAIINVTERQTGVMQAISNIAFDNIGQGLPNSLQFNFNGLMYGKIYDVKVSNVKVNGSLKDYHYWFRIVE